MFIQGLGVWGWGLRVQGFRVLVLFGVQGYSGFGSGLRMKVWYEESVVKAVLRWDVVCEKIFGMKSESFIPIWMKL